MAKDEELLEEELDEEVEEPVEEETKTESKPKQKNHGMFADVIKEYLDNYAKDDPVFNERYQNPSKNINECCDYIINQVKASGRNGFADEEIFALARGYYTDEIDKKDLHTAHATVVVNHTVELTDEEKQKAHDKAVKEYEEQIKKELEAKAKKEEQARIKAEEKAAKKEAERLEKEKQEKEDAKKQGAFEQTSIFDFLGE